MYHIIIILWPNIIIHSYIKTSVYHYTCNLPYWVYVAKGSQTMITKDCLFNRSMRIPTITFWERFQSNFIIIRIWGSWSKSFEWIFAHDVIMTLWTSSCWLFNDKLIFSLCGKFCNFDQTNTGMCHFDNKADKCTEDKQRPIGSVSLTCYPSFIQHSIWFPFTQGSSRPN